MCITSVRNGKKKAKEKVIKKKKEWKKTINLVGPVGFPRKKKQRQVANELLYGGPPNRVQSHQAPLFKGARTDFRNIPKTKNKLLKETCINICI